MRVVLTNANVIDCVHPRPLVGASVTVEHGRIVEVSSAAPDRRDAQVIDLHGAYLLPGLWDVHIHPDYFTATSTSAVEQTVQFGHHLMEALTESGVVGVRCAGSAYFMDVAWKHAFDTWQYIGPRVFACGHFLTTTGGHFLTSGHARECDGPYGFVQAIREQIKNGVDHIKLNLTGGIMGPSWDRHWHSFLLEDELQAAFAICRQRGYKVMAHAANPEAVKAALRLGAHSVEHGYIMDEECIQLFLEHDVWYVPTLAISHLTPGQASNVWEQRWVEQRNLASDLCSPCRYRRRRASRLVPAGPGSGREDGAGLGHPPAQRGRLTRNGSVDQGRGDAMADPVGGNKTCCGPVWGWGRPRDHRGGEARGSDCGAGQPARGHP